MPANSQPPPLHAAAASAAPSLGWRRSRPWAAPPTLWCSASQPAARATPPLLAQSADDQPHANMFLGHRLRPPPCFGSRGIVRLFCSSSAFFLAFFGIFWHFWAFFGIFRHAQDTDVQRHENRNTRTSNEALRRPDEHQVAPAHKVVGSHSLRGTL